MDGQTATTGANGPKSATDPQNAVFDPLHGLGGRLSGVRERIASACARSGRRDGEVTLIAVTKTVGPDVIKELVRLGHVDFGENRVQQMMQRAGQVGEWQTRQRADARAARWHMIGRLQRNKVKSLLTPGVGGVPPVHVIHSVDSLRLAEEIDLHAERVGRPVNVLLQVNASQEPQKGGVSVGAAVHLGEQIATMKHVRLCGLMSMARLDADEREARHTFGRTREVFEEMAWNKIGGEQFRHLSMGMSHDYEWAILEGATLVRIGSALFGTPPATESAMEGD